VHNWCLRRRKLHTVANLFIGLRHMPAFDFQKIIQYYFFESMLIMVYNVHAMLGLDSSLLLSVSWRFDKKNISMLMNSRHCFFTSQSRRYSDRKHIAHGERNHHFFKQNAFEAWALFRELVELMWFIFWMLSVPFFLSVYKQQIKDDLFFEMQLTNFI
jgi:hypothetical protein